MKRLALGLAAVLFASTAWAVDPAQKMETSLGTVWADQNGMTLYTFDTDTQGAMTSACTGECIVNWPPFLATEGAMAEGAWTLVDVVDQDGATKKMWAYDGWPLYLWINDSKPGDVTGEGVGGVWHVAKAE
jgi:predicted lipoprotein with Yx(FWY)xxD motif